jgi:putative membrane protein
VHRLSTLLPLLAPGYLLSAPAALAHEGEPHAYAELWRTWGLEPGVLVPLALAAGLYAVGVRRLWRASAPGRGVSRGEAWCYAGGVLALFVALVSPLHPWGQVLFSAHMTQHEVLMLVAAPLLVLGRPLVPYLWAMPQPWARRLGGWAKAPAWRRTWRALTAPLAAWALHAALLWAWHHPALFQATLTSEAVHALQHAAFLGSALLFWWALVHGRPGPMGYGLAVLYLFTTALHSGLLGGLLTFARSPWYPAYARTTADWGLTPLEDQQLGGLIMWIPAGLVYVAAGLFLFAGWMRESERRALRRDAAWLPTEGS